MASGPHPAGSQGIALTQGYLKEQITEMGYRFQEEACPLDDDALMLRNISVHVDAPGRMRPSCSWPIRIPSPAAQAPLMTLCLSLPCWDTPLRLERTNPKP